MQIDDLALGLAAGVLANLVRTKAKLAGPEVDRFAKIAQSLRRELAP